jgi:tetratricopeptide (TPR) repeat protein
MRVGLLLLVTLMAAVPAAAQCRKVKDKEAVPSATRRDLPPGGAMKLNPGMARVLLAHIIRKKFKASSEAQAYGAPFFDELKTLSVTREYLCYEFDSIYGDGSRTKYHYCLIFKQLDYVNCSPDKLAGFTFFFIDPPLQKEARKSFERAMNKNRFMWADEREALRFTDAFNRLIYETHFGNPGVSELSAFAATAKAWREKPDSRPKPPEGWERYRILAEQRIREKEFVAALENYEAGLESFPTWPEGWFNAALLYAELGEYGYAANRMRRYLELTPDAPDAKAAREKVIIWDEKAKP